MARNGCRLVPKEPEERAYRHRSVGPQRARPHENTIEYPSNGLWGDPGESPYYSEAKYEVRRVPVF